MLFTDLVFAGVSPASHQKTFVYAVLDKGLNLLKLSDGTVDEVTALLAGQSSARIAINAPSGLSRGLSVEKKQDMFKTKKERVLGSYRLGEAELRVRGIAVRGTPSKLEDCPEWMKAGFALYRKLEKSGFAKYPAENELFQVLDTNSQACFCVMNGEMPQPKTSMEGKIQRQLLLYENGLKIKDPMDFFEEITRHKMLKGNWPMELLYSSDQLDAMVAAFTAWMTIHRPESVLSIGDPKEGRITLPVKDLKEKY